MEAMKLKEMNGANFLSYKDIYPVMHKTKTFVIISLHGFEKKVMLSTGKYPRALKNDPVFELVTVTSGQHYVSEIEQLDKVPLEIERRGRGRPSTGKALSSAEKQARYRARKAQETVTVTFNRADLPTLKTLLANAPESLGLSAESIDRLAKAVFDSALAQSV